MTKEAYLEFQEKVFKTELFDGALKRLVISF